jgi:mono/diheme cytochrome c family protein
MSFARRLVASPLVIALGSSLVCAGTLFAAADGLTTKSGVFTAAQTERGKVVYDKSCGNCHPVDFYRERLPKFAGQPVSALFEALSTTMPADNVGSLLTSEYVDVMTYIFSITGSPIGKSEMTPDNMESIKIAPVE